MEKNIIILPQLGEVLRTIITGAGYRGYTVKAGLDKDLDDLATGSRASTTCDRMTSIEIFCFKELASECGPEWEQFFKSTWEKFRGWTQQLARDVDTSRIADEQGQEEVVRTFEIPIVSWFLELATSRHPGPVDDQWWKRPLSAWVKWVAAETDLGGDFLLTNFANHLDASPKSIERWMNGEPTQKLHWPYRPLVQATVYPRTGEGIKAETIDRLTGWLIISVACQSLPTQLRERLRQNAILKRERPWTLEQAIAELNGSALAIGKPQVRAAVIPVMKTIKQNLLSTSRDVVAIHKSLDEFKSLIAQETVFWQRPYQYMHDWFSAQLASIEGKEDLASKFYKTAVMGVWWYGGPIQLQIISEALTYEVGIGNKNNAEQYWDQTFLLGLNTWPKRPLDRQEIRRISFGFEKRFWPQKSKEIIPPNMEFIVRNGPIIFGKAQLANPNSKVKHAQGRTKRTPLMDAITSGTLDDVKRLLTAGGDPNDFIKESGEGPLMYAMRRACDRKDPEIMAYLLTFDMLSKTVNREASTKRETPLKVAIEMADPRTVERLIELGAHVESKCDYVASALCYAMSLLYTSIHQNDRSCELAYMKGKGRADVHDAKDGAILDLELASRRQPLMAIRNASPRNQNIWDALKSYMIRPAEDYRQVVFSLLRHGADANRRYKVEAHDIAEWTPTLFAAQVGDVDIFTALVKSGGNPGLTLSKSPSLEQFDAYGIAVAYKRHAIVDYLQQCQQWR